MCCPTSKVADSTFLLIYGLIHPKDSISSTFYSTFWLVLVPFSQK